MNRINVGHQPQGYQPATLTELCSTLLKVVAIAALVFGVIFGSKQWILIGAISGILSIAAYAYSQFPTLESCNDWIQRVIFGVRNPPQHLRTPSKRPQQLIIPE